MKNYYAILKIDRSADQREIRDAYYELERRYNPALNPGEEHFYELHENVKEAYETLGLENKRKIYDEQYDLYPWEEVRIDSIVNREARGMIFYAICFIFVMILGPISYTVMTRYFPPHPPDVKPYSTIIDSVEAGSTELQTDTVNSIDTTK